MKTYEVIIQPQSGFATPLKGDTLFGHFCWQAASRPDLIDGGLESALAAYHERPFAIFSSAFPVIEQGEGGYALKRPDVPLAWMLDTSGLKRAARLEHLREFKHKKWMVVSRSLALDVETCRFVDDEELFEAVLASAPEKISDLVSRTGVHTFLASFSQVHNTINRLSGSTGSGPFAPYTVDCNQYLPKSRLAVFVVIDDYFTDIARVVEALQGIGRFGFGRDATTGKGRFGVVAWQQLDIPSFNGGVCYTLAPCVPAPGTLRKAFFTPFTRFGKHGDRLAVSKNPFKNPVVMADEGAVFMPSEPSTLSNAYIGSAVRGVSKVQQDAVVQGYAPCLPISLEIVK